MPKEETVKEKKPSKKDKENLASEDAGTEKKVEENVEMEITLESKSPEKPVEGEEAQEKAKAPRDEKTGIAYIYSSPNNTIVHITDLVGNTISKSSGGAVTKHSRLKADPTIAMFAAKKAAERAKDLGITSLYVRIKGKTGEIGIGPGAHAAVRSLDRQGFKIINILEATKYPRGGPKKPHGKRGRRV